MFFSNGVERLDLKPVHIVLVLNVVVLSDFQGFELWTINIHVQLLSGNVWKGGAVHHADLEFVCRRHSWIFYPFRSVRNSVARVGSQAQFKCSSRNKVLENSHCITNVALAVGSQVLLCEHLTSNSVLRADVDQLAYFFWCREKLESTCLPIKVVLGEIQSNRACGTQNKRQFQQEPELSNISCSDYISLAQEDILIGIHGKNILHHEVEEGLDIIDL